MYTEPTSGNAAPEPTEKDVFVSLVSLWPKLDLTSRFPVQFATHSFSGIELFSQVRLIAKQSKAGASPFQLQSADVSLTDAGETFTLIAFSSPGDDNRRGWTAAAR